ncbi:hypothetical protein [Peptoniphilus indolicus]|uniref:Uncharacterized protein n=2 Tax=Peptoniphilus indolicus TaxID=33030 RepID=G4D1X7_9FIRM|nr:hypothetical protein [Peptoniphilus indolicus]EGY80464.1 hypothetical protein HMPREF9129_0407 [Peptoniphilus indolicus ATCC 29427]SUB75509.1 Uncharacterised protein [Peptoniphilus indolicus]
MILQVLKYLLWQDIKTNNNTIGVMYFYLESLLVFGGIICFKYVENSYINYIAIMGVLLLFIYEYKRKNKLMW